jgi:hypothetical protein
MYLMSHNGADQLNTILFDELGLFLLRIHIFIYKTHYRHMGINIIMHPGSSNGYCFICHDQIGK